MKLSLARNRLFIIINRQMPRPIKPTVDDRILLITGLLGYLAILLITLLHRQPPLFDEVLFIPNVHLLERYGLSREFLFNIDNQAPGPLYQFVHYPLRGLTHLTTPGIRLVNVSFLGLLLLLMTVILMLMRQQSFGKAFALSLALVAVPMVWQVSGLALTEMPAMFFSILSVLLLFLALRKDTAVLKSSMLALAGGGSLGLAILGRSPFLVMVPAAFLFVLYETGNAHRWRIVGIYAAAALGMTVPVFIIWHGLTPPRQAFVGEGFSLWHGILAFAYGAMLTLIVAPAWYFFNKRILLGLAGLYLFFLLLNVTWLGYTYSSLSEALRKVLPPFLMRIYPYALSPFLATLAVYFIVCSAVRAREQRKDERWVFLLLCGMLILASTFKVTHLFSTRYVAQAVPFFVLIMTGAKKDDPIFRTGRFVLGMVLGFLSLETYFLFQ